jgi:hypothetical protein
VALEGYVCYSFLVTLGGYRHLDGLGNGDSILVDDCEVLMG